MKLYHRCRGHHVTLFTVEWKWPGAFSMTSIQPPTKIVLSLFSSGRKWDCVHTGRTLSHDKWLWPFKHWKILTLAKMPHLRDTCFLRETGKTFKVWLNPPSIIQTVYTHEGRGRAGAFPSWRWAAGQRDKQPSTLTQFFSGWKNPLPKKMICKGTLSWSHFIFVIFLDYDVFFGKKVQLATNSSWFGTRL